LDPVPQGLELATPDSPDDQDFLDTTEGGILGAEIHDSSSQHGPDARQRLQFPGPGSIDVQPVARFKRLGR